jgi:hypothetical protein
VHIRLSATSKGPRRTHPVGQAVGAG